MKRKKRKRRKNKKKRKRRKKIKGREIKERKREMDDALVVKCANTIIIKAQKKDRERVAAQ